MWNLLNKKWSGVSSTLNGQFEDFSDDKVESYRNASWKAKAAQVLSHTLHPLHAHMDTHMCMYGLTQGMSAEADSGEEGIDGDI